MVDLFKSTVAYRILKGDKKNNTLSHAYAFICEDEYALDIYLKTACKLLMCEEDEEFCNTCRNCRLIDRGTHSDVTFYPTEKGGKIVVGDIDELVSQTYIKPIEGNKRIFVLSRTANMNGASQNKLLKTLEEPPENVFILMGVENENALLPTIKSRVKKLEIPLFNEDQLLKGLSGSLKDGAKLKRAIMLADGKAGKVLEYYNMEDDGKAVDLVLDVLKNMNTSQDVLAFSAKIDKGNIKEFLMCLKKTMFALMRINIGVDKAENDVERELAKKYKIPCSVAVIDKINYQERALFFNGNVTMVAESTLLSILEEKYRWQKL